MSQESSSGRIALISACAGAAATIIAAVITVLAGAVHISITASPAVAVTTTRTVTVAPTISPGTSTQTDTPAPPGGGQGARVWNMAAPYPYADLYFDTGKITAYGCCSDAYYEPTAATKIPQLRINVPYSLGVTNANTNRQQCLTAINQQPKLDPITNLHKGLLICVQANGGVALLNQTQALDESNTLYLQEVYWPNPGQ